LESRFRISAEITYNNFPYPADIEQHRTAITEAAQAVLNAREAHPHSTLADLYDPLATPKDLLNAHHTLDRAVLSAYGLPADSDSTRILATLFDRYASLDSQDSLFPEVTKPVRKGSKRSQK
jgi:hypothetical protein